MISEPILPELEIACDTCNGRGKWDTLDNKFHKCPTCNGTGKVPSDFGWEIYEFVTRISESARRREQREDD